jgi:hypothetical protein
VVARVSSRLSRGLVAVLTCVVVGALVTGAVVDGIEAREASTSCLPTEPNGYTPPGTVARATNHGEGALMVSLWTWPSIDDPRLVRPSGAIRIKLGWWRAESGQLRLAARRTDDAAPRPHTSVGSVASYGESGPVPSSLLFATRGCYEVVGRLGGSELSFVVRIDVGRDKWVPPEVKRLSVRVRNGVASVRWGSSPGIARFDLALRRDTGPWQLVRKASELGTTVQLRPRLGGRYAVRLRAHDEFGAGRWSAPTIFRIRQTSLPA